MKKLLLSAVLTVMSTVAVLGSTIIDGIAYNLDAGNSTAEVICNNYSYNNDVSIPNPTYTGDISIPGKVNYEGGEYSVTSIGDDAFFGCNGLTSIVIPEGVTSIGDNAFSSCNGLTSIAIPVGVTSIGDNAFFGCSGLATITVSDANTEYKSIDGIVYSKNGKIVILCPEGKTGKIIIPEGVTSIGENAFFCCSGLTSVVIPQGVTSIGKDAFWGCSDLTSVVIPEGVASIGENAFRDCRGLRSVVIPEGVTSIGKDAFSGCRSLTSVDIPSSVKSIGINVFYDCRGLTSVAIPEGVTSIGENAFYGCSGLTSVDIPSSVTIIDNYAFYNCTKLKTVYNKSGLDIEKGSKTYGFVAYYANEVMTIKTGVEEREDTVKEVYYIGMNGQRYEAMAEDAPFVKVTVMQSGKVKTEKVMR